MTKNIPSLDSATDTTSHDPFRVRAEESSTSSFFNVPFRYLPAGLSGFSPLITKLDKDAFESLKSALVEIGLDSEFQMHIFKLLSCVLHLGNLTFTPYVDSATGTERCSLLNTPHVAYIEAQLGIE